MKEYFYKYCNQMVILSFEDVEFEIIGLRIEKTLLDKCEGFNCNFEYHLEHGDQYIFLLKNGPKKLELIFYEKEHECQSGYCEAVSAMAELKIVKKFGGKTHIPIGDKKYIRISVNKDYDIYELPGYGNANSYVINHDYFEFSENGGDCYYPCGYVKIHMDKFKLLNKNRIKEKRPIWIFFGDSCTGKTYLSSKIDDLNSYETDSSSELPNKITESIIVVGNKYKYSLKEIKDRIFDLENCELIIVGFDKLKEKNEFPKKREEYEKEIRELKEQIKCLPGGTDYLIAKGEFEYLKII